MKKFKIIIINSISTFFIQWKKIREEYKYLKKLFKKFERTQILNKTIVFNTVKGIRGYFDREFFVGKVLALNGAKVKILLDDGVLFHKESGVINRFQWLKQPLEFIRKKIIFKNAIKTYRDSNLEIIYYSTFLKAKKINYKDWKEVKQFAHSSTVRFFQTSELDYKKKRIKDFFILSLKNSILSRNVGEFILNEIQPDFFLTSHGIYSTWGPAYEFLKTKGIKSLIFTRSHSHSNDLQDTYFTYAKAQTLTRCKFWHKYQHTPVTDKMRKEVENLFLQRINYNTKDTKMYYHKKPGLYQVDKDDEYKYHIAIFPSLIWDGDIIDRHIAFKSILDWLISTIDFFKSQKDVKIFLKFHPAEVTIFNKSARIQDLIQDYLKSSNITNLEIIPTEKNIDPYIFLKSGIDLGICYDGVLALELPFLKIPVILGGVQGRFSVDGGNFTIRNREDYFNLLKNFRTHIEDFNSNFNVYYNNIVRYTYWYVFKNVYKLPTLSKNKKGKIDLFQVKEEDLILNEILLRIFKD